MHAKAEIAAGFAAQLGATIRRERERLELRQDELALAAGVSTRVVHQIENGKATSRLDSLVPVLDVLGLTLGVRGHEERRAGEGGRP
jgi:y4mF family transcriptional regulator